MSLASLPRALFILPEQNFDLIYGPEQRRQLREFVTLPDTTLDPAELANHAAELREVELIFSGWGAPKLDKAFLASAPRLRAFFYGSGSIKKIVTPAFWQRDIAITSAYAANAVPVAEFTLAEIILSLKRLWTHAREVRERRDYSGGREVKGTCGSTVGLVSLGVIGRLVRERLRALDVHVLAYDPFLTADRARELDVESCSLEELFRRSDVVSLHTPWLPETEGLINGSLMESMPSGATLINTARGAVVNETDLISVLTRRTDLVAVLDVTYPEPPVPDSPFYTLPNVVLTPHIAGALGGECRRLGQAMVDEARLFLSGQPMRWRITEAQEAVMA